MNRPCALGVLFMCLPLLNQEIAQYQFDRFDSVMWGGEVLQTREFQLDHIERRYKQILVEKDSSVRVISAVFMDSTNSTILSQMGYTDITYGLWRTLFQDYEKRIPPFAEMVAIGDNVAMRIRDQQGNVSLSVLRGQDPLVVKSCGTPLSMVHLGISKSLRPTCKDQWYVNLHFFFTTAGTVDEHTTKCALDEMHKLTSHDDIVLSLRNDPWFILDSDFPVVPPFITAFKPPTLEEYEASPWSECFISQGKTMCQHWLGRPSRLK